MKGRIGYFITRFSLIRSAELALYLNENANLPENLVILMIGLILFSGFLGGFFAPYNVGKNSLYAVITLILVMGTPIVIFLVAIKNVDQTADPLV